jgi:hypothetical protein
MRHSRQVVVLIKSGSLFGNFLKVVAAVAQIEKVPSAMVAPVLRVVTAKVGEGTEGALCWQELADSTRCKGNLNTT